MAIMETGTGSGSTGAVGALEVRGPPTDETYDRIAELGQQLSGKIKG